MIARVVPITRIRRDTASWSYIIPTGRQVVSGSLVVIPFAGRECLGVVWETEEKDEKAKKVLSQILSNVPLIRAPQRHFIEYLSLIGLCSLSTALYVWLPRALRQWPLRKATLELIATYQPSSAIHPQHAVLVPGKRPEQEELLEKKFQHDFIRLYADSSEAEEIEHWFKILKGEIRVASGREGALFAPWGNLQQITIIEPEDIFYYHEQVPYLNLVEAAEELARISKAQTSIRTYLPTDSSSLLWNNSSGADTPHYNLRFIDLHREEIINDTLVKAIQNTLTLNQKVLLLYNAHDRLHNHTKEGLTASVLIPGVETLSKQLALALDRSIFEPDIIIGTRTIFTQQHQDIGLVAALSLDPLLETVNFADQIHGLADLGHLFSYACPAIIQSYRQEHPLMNALRQGQLNTYSSQLIQEHKQLALPPFGQQIVLAYPNKVGVRELIDKLRSQLEPLMGHSWQISHPLLTPWHKKPFWHLMLETADPATRLPATIRKTIISLPAPWRVLRNPTHLI